MRDQQRVAIVTGGSRGIGAACALRLAGAGCAVAVNFMHSPGAADDVVAAIEAQGGRAVALKADVSDVAQVPGLVAEVTERLGPPLIVVNNAGLQRARALISQPVDDLDAMIDLNLRGAWAVTQAALPAMYDASWGRIVFISSVTATGGGPGDSGYAATKAALVGMSNSLAQEVAPRRITSNAVLPGTISTDLAAHVDAAVLERNVAALAARRAGTPREVAAAVTFLCSDEASYVNGAQLAVHGGGWLSAPPATGGH